MRKGKMLLILLAVAAAITPLAAQGMTVVPAVRAKERLEEYRLADEAWRVASQNLEREFLRVEASTALARINWASEKAVLKILARDAYNQAVLEQMRAQITLLGPAHVLPTEELKQTVSEQLVNIRSTKESLGSQLMKEDGSPEKTLVNEKIKQQLQSLEDLEKNLWQQKETATQIGNTSASLEKSRSAALGSYQQVFEMLRAQAAKDREEAIVWADYYRALREAVEERERKTQGKGTTSVKKGATSKPKP